MHLIMLQFTDKGRKVKMSEFPEMEQAFVSLTS